MSILFYSCTKISKEDHHMKFVNLTCDSVLLKISSTGGGSGFTLLPCDTVNLFDHEGNMPIFDQEYKVYQLKGDSSYLKYTGRVIYVNYIKY